MHKIVSLIGVSAIENWVVSKRKLELGNLEIYSLDKSQPHLE